MSRGKSIPRRILLIGADGMDPQVLERLMGAGHLPNLSRLRAEGAFGAMRTTYPPVSPVAWTSLLTGCWPAKHGIIDFVTRAPRSYRPTLGLYSIRPDAAGQLQYHSYRSVPTVAELLGAEDLSSYLLHIPGTFPPPQIKGGALAGLGAPDLLGSFGVPALYTTDVDALPAELRRRPEVTPLAAADNGVWQGTMAGPGEAGLPLTLRRRGDGLALRIASRDEELRLALERWSDWVEVSFAQHDGEVLRGICRFFLLQAASNIVLYRTPLHHSPAAPGVPLCWPSDFAPRLASEIGLFPTASFPMEQAGYQDGLLPVDAFLAGAYDAWEGQVQIAETLIERADWALLAMHLFTADTLQHLFWPDVEGVIAAGYRWLDKVIGRLHDLAGRETLLIVASDHGVAPLDHWVHLNRWLHREGFLAVDDRGRIDWHETRAFCLGYGGIYLNVMDREPAGIVEPGQPYERARRELIDRLVALRDPYTDQQIVQHALPREAWNAGVHVGRMPDLIVTFHRGYGLARQDARGQIPSGGEVVEENHGRWRGGHEGPYAPDQVPGIFLAAGADIRHTQLRDATIVDVAPTILTMLGLKPTSEMDGQPLNAIFEAEPHP